MQISLVAYVYRMNTFVVVSVGCWILRLIVLYVKKGIFCEFRTTQNCLCICVFTRIKIVI